MRTKKRHLLFLDIDGVLHPAALGQHQDRDAIVKGKHDPRDSGCLCPERQLLLAGILHSHPNLDVVITSNWRTWQPEGRMDWLQKYLLPEIAVRITGRTGVARSETTWEGGARLAEIREYMARPDVQELYERQWVAVDDEFGNFGHGLQPYYAEYSAFPDSTFLIHRRWEADTSSDEVLVLIHGKKALTEMTAGVINEALRYACGMPPVVHAERPRSELTPDVCSYAHSLVATGHRWPNLLTPVPAACSNEFVDELRSGLQERASQSERVIVIDLNEVDRSDAAGWLLTQVLGELDIVDYCGRRENALDSIVQTLLSKERGGAGATLIFHGIEKLVSDPEAVFMIRTWTSQIRESRCIRIFLVDTSGSGQCFGPYEDLERSGIRSCRIDAWYPSQHHG